MEKLNSRIQDLIDKSKYLLDTVRYSAEYGYDYWINESYNVEAYAWITSTIHSIGLVTPQGSYYFSELEAIRKHEDMSSSSVAVHIVRKLSGLLISIRQDLEAKLIGDIEYLFAASVFDDFLEHAKEFHGKGMKQESAVLAGIVFEDTVRKIAKKNAIEESGKNIDRIIDDFVKASIINTAKAKKLKSFADTRNSAVHAQYDEIDIKDVGHLISGVQELLENYL